MVMATHLAFPLTSNFASLPDGERRGRAARFCKLGEGTDRAIQEFRRQPCGRLVPDPRGWAWYKSSRYSDFHALRAPPLALRKRRHRRDFSQTYGVTDAV